MPPFRPEGFREVAEKLHGGVAIASSEARHRSVTGRCYYAAYLAVSIAIFQKYGIQRKDYAYPDHKGLGESLAKLHGDVELKQIGSALVDLLARRHLADYWMEVEHVEDNADDSLADVRRVEKLLTPDVAKRLPRLTGNKL